MFFQHKLLLANKSSTLQDSGLLSGSSSRIRRSSSGDEGGVSERNINKAKSVYSPAPSLWQYVKRQAWRAKKRVKRAIHTHGLRIYRPMTLQKAWAPRPHNASFAGTMWIDVTLVGVVYRLDEFFLSTANDSFSGFWIPYMLFFAVYDAWETGPLLQAEFKNNGISLVHALLQLISWLVIALMGATIPYRRLDASDSLSEQYGNLTILWTSGDQSVFTSLKLAHTCLRVLMYADILVLSKSKRARNAALPRFITYFLGAIPLAIAPILVTYKVHSSIVASCFLMSFFAQKLGWHCITMFNMGGLRVKAQNVRTNMPFIITRLRDWTQLQLGACMLGMLTENLQTMEFTSNRVHLYVVLVTSFFFLAWLDLLSYSADPRVFHDHALIKGGTRSIIWFELFTILGISLLGVAVGLRYVFQTPAPSVPNSRPNLLWLLAVSSVVATVAIQLQEAVHGALRRKIHMRKRLVTLKAFLAFTCLIAPGFVWGNKDSSANYYVSINLMITTWMVLFIHALSGGFRREIAQRTDFKLNGRILAALIARQWLQRARRNIAERKRLMSMDSDRNVSNIDAEAGLAGNLVPFAVGDVEIEPSIHNRIPDVPLARSKSLVSTSSGNHGRQSDLDGLNTLDAIVATFIGSQTADGPAEMSRKASRTEDELSHHGSILGHSASMGSIDPAADSLVILRAIASFRKGSSLISPELSERVLAEDDDDTITDENEAAILIDPDMDIFMDDGFADDDDNDDDNDRLVDEAGYSVHHKREASTIEEEAEGDPEAMDFNETADGSQRNIAALGEPGSSFAASDNPAFETLGADDKQVMEIGTQGSSRRMIGRQGSAKSEISAKDARSVRGSNLSAMSSSRQRNVQFASEQLPKIVSGPLQAGDLRRRRRQRLVNKNPVARRIVKKKINERFYERPHLLAVQDVFAEYSVSWSDLFLDIIYVGVVYRLGDYLAQGVQARHASPVENSLSRILYLFACLFYAIYSLWFTKLGFSSKCGITDVFHKLLDVAQALVVVIAAANVTSPLELSKPGSYRPCVISACLCMFHLSMMWLWFEISVGKPKTTTEYACSRRNMRRAALALAAVGVSMVAWGLDSPIEVVSLFWALSWFLPVLERFLTANNLPTEQKAPFLLRYVLHRLGDGALILLGEAVFQIIRAVGAFGLIPFMVFAMSFLNVALARIALFQMDCFDAHAKKHAVFNSRLAHVGIQFVRALASPAVVGMGVALKLIVGMVTKETSTTCVDTAYYELLCTSSIISLTSFTAIYHLHRTMYFRHFRWKHFLVGMLICSLFLIWPWLDCAHPLLVTSGCVIIWSLAIAFHAVTDDLFSAKDDQGLATLTKSENDKTVAHRATRAATQSIYKISAVE